MLPTSAGYEPVFAERTCNTAGNAVSRLNSYIDSRNWQQIEIPEPVFPSFKVGSPNRSAMRTKIGRLIRLRGFIRNKAIFSHIIVWAAMEEKRIFWHVPPTKTNQPAHPHSLIRAFAVRINKLDILGYTKCACENSDQTVHAQAALNLRWAHMSKVTFTDIYFRRNKELFIFCILSSPPFIPITFSTPCTNWAVDRLISILSFPRK